VSLVESIRADFLGFLALDKKRGPSLRRELDVLTLPGFWAVVIFRVNVVLYRARARPLSRILYLLACILFGVEMHPGAEVGPGLTVPHPVGVGFGAAVKLGKNVRIFKGAGMGTAGHDDPARDGFPVVEDGATFFDGAFAFGPIRIGHDAVISANSVVLRDVPPGAIMIGNPARLSGYRDGFEPAPGAAAVISAAGASSRGPATRRAEDRPEAQ
jgi:serine O-acetyltransferase